MKVDDHNYYTFDLFNSFKLVDGKMKKEGSHIAYPEQLSWNSVSQRLYHTLSLKQCTNRNLFFFQKPTYQLKGVICHEGGTLQGGHYIAYVRKGTAWYKMDDYKVSIEALGVYMYNGSSPPSQYALSLLECRLHA